jgi:(p)ppGpp synthase/HD superfamily hydrolase
LTERFRRAFDLAGEVHATQLRKGGGYIPYIAHVMSVSALVLEHGGGEDAAVGGLLHDAVEDSDDGTAMEQRIRSEFGDRVGDIVMSCSDAVAVPGQAKQEWHARKTAYIEHLAGVKDPDILLVSVCDKLHNARAIASDLRAEGDAAWSRFKVGRADQLWYYDALVNLYMAKTPRDSVRNKARGAVVDELDRVVADIKTL